MGQNDMSHQLEGGKSKGDVNLSTVVKSALFPIVIAGGATAGALTGGASGAAVGVAVGGPVGAGIGFVVGFTSGILGGGAGGAIAIKKTVKIIDNYSEED